MKEPDAASLATPGRVALITGASRGIGRSIARALGGRGWSVVINFHVNEDAARATLGDVEASGGRGIVVTGDVASGTDRERLVAAAVETWGRIDLLVNNAGIAPPVRLDILEATESSYDEVMATNLKGPFFLTQVVAREMLSEIERKVIDRGIIVNMGSMSAYTASLNRAEYCLSKAGMGMMTALFAARLADHGINVYEVRPGIIATDMTGPVRERYNQLIADGLTPIRRWGEGEDVARAVVALADGALPYSTGEVINVDGGFHLRRL